MVELGAGWGRGVVGGCVLQDPWRDRTRGGRGGGGWETGRVDDDKQPNGGKALGLILLAMIAILAVIVGLAVVATKTG